MEKIFSVALILTSIFCGNVFGSPSTPKPSPDQAIEKHVAGNDRFVSGHGQQPHTDSARLSQAGTENQGNHANANASTDADRGAPGAHGVPAVHAEPVPLIDAQELARLDAARHREWSVDANGLVTLNTEEAGVMMWVWISLGVVGGFLFLLKSHILDRVKVSTKMFGGFATVSLLTLLLGFGAFYYRGVVDGNVEREVASLELDALVGGAAKLQNKFLLVGIQDQHLGEEVEKEHGRVMGRLREGLSHMAVMEMNTDDHEMLARIQEFEKVYEKMFGEIVEKYHNIEINKVVLDELNIKLDTALADLLHKHERDLEKQKSSGASMEEISEQTALIMLLSECEVRALRLGREEVEFLLDKHVDRIAHMENLLGELTVFMELLEPRVVAAGLNPSEVAGDLEKLAKFEEWVEIYIEKLGELILDELVVSADLVDCEEALGSIEVLAVGLAESASLQVKQAKGEADVATFVLIGLTLFVGFSLGQLISRSITHPLNSVVESLTIISEERDLTQRMDGDRTDELGVLARSFNKVMANLQETIRIVQASANDVAGASTELSANSEQLSAGMSEQASQADQVAAAVEQMNATVLEVAKKSTDASRNAENAGAQANRGGEIVGKTVESINEISNVVSESAASVRKLGEKSEEIGQVIQVINDIADQTNLLALNAAIEAARAGEHGRGFAVVADEVRKLAERTTEATKEVGDSIQSIQTETVTAVERMNHGAERVGVGVKLAEEAGESLCEIVGGSNEVMSMIESIATASEEQAQTAGQIAQNIEEISNVTRQSTESTEQAASAASELSRGAEELKGLVEQFKI